MGQLTGQMHRCVKVKKRRWRMGTTPSVNGHRWQQRRSPLPRSALGRWCRRPVLGHALRLRAKRSSKSYPAILSAVPPRVNICRPLFYKLCRGVGIYRTTSACGNCRVLVREHARTGALQCLAIVAEVTSYQGKAETVANLNRRVYRHCGRPCAGPSNNRL